MTSKLINQLGTEEKIDLCIEEESRMMEQQDRKKKSCIWNIVYKFFSCFKASKLTRKERRRLSTFKTKYRPSENIRKFECAICLDNILSSSYGLPCLHNFCRACMEEWVTKQIQNNTKNERDTALSMSVACPLCMVEFDI